MKHFLALRHSTFFIRVFEQVTTSQLSRFASRNLHSRRYSRAKQMQDVQSECTTTPSKPPKDGFKSDDVVQMSKSTIKRKHSRESTPKRPPASRANFLLSSMKKSGRKLNRTLTPPRNIAVGCSASSNKSSRRRTCANHLTMSPQLLDATTYQIRSSEMDPTAFQVDLPSFDEIFSHAKICNVMDNYTEVGGREFDFSSLMLWKARDKLVFRAPEDSRDESSPNNATTSSLENPIHSALKNAVPDILVEGFFREYFEDKASESGLGRIEAVVFSSEHRRQFIVCYRGSSDVQNRPVYGNSTKLVDNCNLQQSLKILNDCVYSLLYRLSILKPFCDVVMTGHSFGGILSTFSGEFFAREHPVMRISCHVFGCPRVHDLEFRRSAHSLPNFKVVRVERRQDPFVSLPEGQGWSHVGHAIVLSNQTLPFQPCEEVLNVNAYRFDTHRPSSNFVQLVKESMCSISNLGRQKSGNEIHSYLKDMERFHESSLPWVLEYEGEAGTGIFGNDKEARLLA